MPSKGCAKWHSGSIVQVLCNLRYDFQVIAGPLQWLKTTYMIANASNQGVFRTHIIQCMYNFRQAPYALWRGGAGEGASFGLQGALLMKFQDIWMQAE